MPILNFKSIFVLLGTVIFISGCTLINNVKELPPTFTPQKNQAIVIYGVGLESAWKTPKFQIRLDEYSLKTKSITGNCMFYNRTEAIIPSSRKIEYFAFNVPSGYYTYSGFNGSGLNSKKEIDTFISSTYQPPGIEPYFAYAASKNKVTYIGDFVLTDAGYVVLRRDLNFVKIDIKKKFPNLEQNIELAESVQIPQPNVFFCTP